MTCRRTYRSSVLSLSVLSFLSILPVLLACSGCAVNASAGMASPLAMQQGLTSTGTVGAQFFGMVVRTAGATPAVAVGSRRLWDAGVSWAALEPSRGVYTWQTLDADVAAAQQQGEQVVLTLGMTPVWASSAPELASTYGNGATAMPSNLADWDAYVSAVAARYSGRIAAYEVWNAPEDPVYWSSHGQPAGTAMATLALHAAGDIHAADPAALLVSPALSAAGLSSFLAAGGGAAVNVIGVSLDVDGQAPETMTSALAAVQQALVGTAAVGKPIWNEQAAWQLPASGLSASTQAAYVARAILLNAGYGVARMHWYAWDDSSQNSLALTDAQATPTQAALAYATVENWLSGAQMNGCAASADGLWICQLVRSVKPEWVVWTGAGTLSSSTLGATVETDLSGNVTQLNGTTTVTVGASPILLQ